MNPFDVLFVAIEIALIIGFAVMVSRLDIATPSPSQLGEPFSASRLPDRPRGLQEDDLPRFVFRDGAPSLNPA